ncbi:MAG: hypothetical protein AAB417_03970 [Patescibacteria group bacterium]
MRLWIFKRRLAGFGIIFLLLAILVAALAWSFWPQPSCTDEKQNGTEQDIDCGGNCPNKCLGEIVKPPLVLWKDYFIVRAGVFDVGALIENQNIKLGVKKFEYIFKVYDKAGLLVSQKEGRTFLYPGEQLFVFEANLVTGPLHPSYVEFNYKPIAWEPMDTDNPLKIDLVSWDYQSEPNPIIRATIANRSLFEEQNIEMTLRLENTNGNAYAASKTFIKTFPPQSTQDVIFTWPPASFEAPSTISPLYRRILR